MFATRGKTLLSVITGVWLVSLNAGAGLTYEASGTDSITGKAISASVTFNITDNSELVVSLSNLGAPISNTSDILSAVFFNLNGVGTLTPVSAALGPGSLLVNGPTSSGRTVGDMWEYLGGLSGGDTRGISAAGFGMFGYGNFGSNGENLDGSSFGLINGSPSGGNLPINPCENNSMVFTLKGLPAGFCLSSIKDVEFLWGTSLHGEHLRCGAPVPEPSTVALLGLGTAALAFRRNGRGRRK